MYLSVSGVCFCGWFVYFGLSYFSGACGLEITVVIGSDDVFCFECLMWRDGIFQVVSFVVWVVV